MSLNFQMSSSNANAKAKAKTVVVLLSDQGYWSKAQRTILDIRSVGQYWGDLYFIAIDFTPPRTWCDFYKVNVVTFPKIPTNDLIEKIKSHPFVGSDKREFKKTNQWEKLHLFDDFFSAWERVLFFDAGLRILDSLDYFLELEWEGKFLCQDDVGATGPDKRLGCQMELSNESVIESLKEEFGDDCLQKRYFLNCCWIFDTSLLKVRGGLVSKEDLIEVMNKYPVCRTNEMGVMNLVLHVKYGLWEPFPYKASNGKWLFDWCESNFYHINPSTTWRDFVSIKYPATITFSME